jgi:hypothetical protein
MDGFRANKRIRPCVMMGGSFKKKAAQNLASWTAADILDSLLNSLNAIFRIGMCTEELRRLVACSRGSQHLHHTDQFIGIITRVIDKTNSQII